jgi:hypothetical protein
MQKIVDVHLATPASLLQVATSIVPLAMVAQFQPLMGAVVISVSKGNMQSQVMPLAKSVRQAQYLLVNVILVCLVHLNSTRRLELFGVLHVDPGLFQRATEVCARLARKDATQ